MRTNLSKKQRNEKVRQMVRELAYFSAIGKKITIKELSLKYQIGNAVFTIAQHLGYIEKKRSGVYSVNVDFTDEIIDELYAAHAANTKESTKKNKPIESKNQNTLFTEEKIRQAVDMGNAIIHCFNEMNNQTTVNVSEEIYDLLGELNELRKKAERAEDFLRRLLIPNEIQKPSEL